jgi:hypothetical protein
MVAKGVGSNEFFTCLLLFSFTIGIIDSTMLYSGWRFLIEHKNDIREDNYLSNLLIK